jgi:proline racemase
MIGSSVTIQRMFSCIWLDTYGEETRYITGQGEVVAEKHLCKDYNVIRNEQSDLTRFDIAEFRSTSKVSIPMVTKRASPQVIIRAFLCAPFNGMNT